MRVFLIMLTVLTALASARAFAAEPVVVDAEGVAIKSDAYDVRKKAIDDSLSKAVLLAADAVIRQEGIKNAPAKQAIADLSADPTVFVLTYKILSEGWMTHFDISQQALEEALGPAKPDTDAHQLSDAQASGVEVYHIRVNASIDEKKLYAAIVNLRGGATSKPAESYSVTLIDMLDFNAYSAAASAIDASPDVKDVNYGTFYRGKIVLTLTSFLSGAALVERLSKDLGPGFAVELTSVRAISIKPASAQPTQNEAQ